jgi:hypothetical protein
MANRLFRYTGENCTVAMHPLRRNTRNLLWGNSVIKKLFLLALAVVLSACAGPQITRIQSLSETADAPYKNVLVISLFESFDARRYLEEELVRQLTDKGVTAVASTSLMNTRTPVTRQTFLKMVESLDSDAVLVTRLMNLDTKTKVKDARPEATHIIRPTYYYNVFSVELTEFVAPQDMRFTHSLMLSTQLFSASQRGPVWAIESKTKLTRDQQNRGDTAFIVDEAKAITRHMSKDGLIARDQD